ncbi:MAG: hypothetical protein PHP35_00775 [Candidatus Colwellbacteria bacterium]|nr:hypothetical protein [Candidatus Colwellbacteria bacterium]
MRFNFVPPRSYGVKRDDPKIRFLPVYHSYELLIHKSVDFFQNNNLKEIVFDFPIVKILSLLSGLKNRSESGLDLAGERRLRQVPLPGSYGYYHLPDEYRDRNNLCQEVVS